MKKVLFYICIILTACLNNDAQVIPTTLEAYATVNNKQLNGTKWELVEPQVGGITIEFSLNTVTRTTKYSDETIKKQLYYYISDSIPNKFDTSHIGNSEEGSTIVIRGTEENSKFIGYKIVKYDKDSLHIFYQAPHNTMFGGDELNLIYRRIK